MIITSEVEQKNAYLQLISKIIDGFKPTVSNDFDRSDQQLNETYKKIIQYVEAKAGSVRLLPSVGTIRENQRLWIRYRDASVRLFMSINTSVDEGLWKSWLAETREEQLKDILSLYKN